MLKIAQKEKAPRSDWRAFKHEGINSEKKE
jgi:hypothetical protein